MKIKLFYWSKNICSENGMKKLVIKDSWKYDLFNDYNMFIKRVILEKMRVCIGLDI